ncbi:MAG: extracellular solute-binding protein [Clostridiaceae bacterium]|nr:extracellular solute-binding protein [Clostridiaceae bacterium]
MLRKKNYLLSILVVLLLVLPLGACTLPQSGTDNTTASVKPTESSTVGETTVEKGLYPFKDNITLSILTVADSNVQSAGYNDWGDTEFCKYWQEATGVNLDIKSMTKEAVQLQLSSGDYPDIARICDSTYPGGLLKKIEDELAIDLMDYADYMPDYLNTIHITEEYENYVTYTDGGIYFFANFIEVGNPTLSWRGVVLRQDFLDKLGMEIPTTNQEFYDVLKAFKDDLGCDAPFSASWWYNLLVDGFMTTEYGLVTSRSYQKDGKYYYGAYEKEYKDALAYLNRLYNEGLLDINFQTTDEATSQASLLNGKTGAHYTSAARINTLWNNATDSNFALVGIGSLNGSDGTKALYSQSDSLTPARCNAYITADCENPEAAVALFNWLYTDEGKIISNFGVEDLCWKEVNGVPTFTEYMTKNENGLSLDNMLYVQTMGNRPKVSITGVSLQRFARPEQVTAQERWADSQVRKYMLPQFTISDSDLNKEETLLWSDIVTYIKECRSKFISGAMNLDSDFDTYLNTLKSMGMDRVLELNQIGLDEYNSK